MTAVHRIFLLIVSLSLISCASPRGFPDRVVDSDVELKGLQEYFEPSKISDYSKNINEDERKKIRDEIINARLNAIDIQFSLFQQKLHQEGVGMNLASDAIVLGLSAAGALVSGGASQVLSGASAAVVGMKGSIDKKLFFEQTMPALFAQMIAKRKAVLVNIRYGLRQNTDSYPLHQGLTDLEAYWFAGTIPGAITSIVSEAGAQSAHANEQLAEIVKNSYVVDEITLALKELLNPGGERKRERWYVLQKWLESEGINLSVASFMNARGMEDKRKEAITYLKSQLK